MPKSVQVRDRLTKPQILEALSEGVTSEKLFTSHGYTTDVRFYQMRKEDQDFDAECKRILAIPLRERRAKARGKHVHKTRPPKVQPKPDTKRWQITFLRVYQEERDRVLAARRAGVTTSHFMDSINPEHKDFDASFAQAWKEIELDQAFQVEDTLVQNAILRKDVQSIKHLLPTMPVVGEKYRKQEERTSGNILALVFNANNRELAVSKIHSALGEPEIDVTPSREMLQDKPEGDFPEPKAALLS